VTNLQSVAGCGSGVLDMVFWESPWTGRRDTDENKKIICPPKKKMLFINDQQQPNLRSA
jgi:hypothetical protein